MPNKKASGEINKAYNEVSFSNGNKNYSTSANIPAMEKLQKIINTKCNVNNFPIDAHKDYKCVWEHAFKQGKGSPIEDHQDYRRLMEKYAIKGKCGYLPCGDIMNHPQYEIERKRWLKECYNRPITEHPEYLNLMKEYAIEIKSNSKCGENMFLPCKDITKHPEYEKEKKRLMNNWSKISITKHPQYREEVERVLKKLLENFGKSTGSNNCQAGGSADLAALVDLYGGACDVTSKFKSNATDDELKSIYSDIVRGQSKPCPPIPINQHPQYDKLVETLTNKIKSEFGYSEKGSDIIKKCKDRVVEIKKEEANKCREKLQCSEKNGDKKVQICRDDMERLKKKMNCKLREESNKCDEEKRKLNSKMQQQGEKCNEDKQKLRKELELCQQALKKCKTSPVCEHPDYANAVRREQKKLLQMIRDEQKKCSSWTIPINTNIPIDIETSNNTSNNVSNNAGKSVSPNSEVDIQSGGKKKRPMMG